ncbi:MAG: DUF935 domain-containing protein [Pseudomonadales bacterium]|nr:DUF935 domain-containing protein [Pseudomonadales bacterium]
MSIKTLIKKLFGSDAQDALDEQQTSGDARIGQLRREFAEHPSKGLTPERLYQILESAEQGDLKAQSELFDDMEEKDPQIGADMAKRRQLAAELEWQIVPPDSASAAEKRAADHAIEVFGCLDVEDLIIDMGAALGHGWTNLEIPWERDGAQRYIGQPQWRPHSWFRLHPDDQNRIMLRDMSRTGAELWPLGWVQHRHKAKPGYVARTGLHRMLVWPYLFQNYALGDLAQLLEIYGLPARVGKYPRNASEKEKATLLRAVVSLGQNAAGIIPDGMQIDFLQAAEGHADMYQAMMTWCERAKSKVILGGTLTSGTGEGTNTNALGNVHERGQHSLIKSDCRQYASTIRRDILWPLAALNFGIDDPRRAPRFFIDAGETADLKLLADSLPIFVSMGAQIPQWWLHEKSGIPKAGDDDEVLQAAPPAAPVSPFGAFRALPGPGTAALMQPALKPLSVDAPQVQLSRLESAADVHIEQWVEQIREQVMQARDLDDLRNRLVTLLPGLSIDQFADVMTDALSAAHLAGRYDILEGL